MGVRLWAVTVGIAVLGTVAVVPAAAAPPDFYDPPTSLPAENGDVIRSEPSTFFLDPLHAIKVDATVNRVLYRSTDRAGRPIAVSGTVITPKSAWAGKGERPIVGYAPGTQGMGDQCAPSRQLSAGSEYEGPFISGLLLRGYGIAVPDYQGLGTPGLHTYMDRVAQGTATLDVVRAARRLPAANLPDNGPVAIAGYSQGGGAAASAAELAGTYAPDLDVRGVVAGAVPADLRAVGENIDGSPYFAFLGFSVSGLAASYDVDVLPYLNDKGRAAFADLEKQCTIQAIAKYPFVRSSSMTADGRSLLATLDGDPQLKQIMLDQRIGRTKPAMPVLVTHSTLDDVIPFTIGTRLVRDWCGTGARVGFAPNIAPTHVGGAVAAYPTMFAWLEGRFAGLPAPSVC